jgi:hypothetical protein
MPLGGWLEVDARRRGRTFSFTPAVFLSLEVDCHSVGSLDDPAGTAVSGCQQDPPHFSFGRNFDGFLVNTLRRS